MFKLGDKVRVKKGLTEKEILHEYLMCDPLDEEDKKEILDFYFDTEKVYVLIDVGNDCAVKEFGYVLIDYLLEKVDDGLC